MEDDVGLLVGVSLRTPSYSLRPPVDGFEVNKRTQTVLSFSRRKGRPSRVGDRSDLGSEGRNKVFERINSKET